MQAGAQAKRGSRRNSRDFGAAGGADNQLVSKDFKIFMGARVQWPADCSDDTLEFIINSTHDILKTHDVARDGMKIVETLKKQLDDKYEPYWHVFMGKNFGTHVVHEQRKFVFFYINKYAFLLYKIG